VEFRGLKMKLVDAEYQFDKGKLTFYFTAESRVDFRELVKDLSAHFRTRIELRQIGVRDETKKFGGYGPCGRPLCCATFLNEFESISTQYIQIQNLAVNPIKLSGVCGRLMCCLAYEYPMYKELAEKYPRVKDKINTPEGEAEVIAIDYIQEIMTLRFPDERYKPITFREWRKMTKKGV
jgi:cell fate regulator YaaT (PSP1 superfamily)